MLVKQLVQHGNSRALIIDRSILNAAGLDEDALFQIVVDSNSGVTIQSIKPVNSKFDEASEYILNKYDGLLERLSKR